MTISGSDFHQTSSSVTLTLQNVEDHGNETHPSIVAPWVYLDPWLARSFSSSPWRSDTNTTKPAPDSRKHLILALTSQESQDGAFNEAMGDTTETLRLGGGWSRQRETHPTKNFLNTELWECVWSVTGWLN